MTNRPFERFLNGLPDAITAGYFLMLWVSPLVFGDHGVRTGMLIMLVEFITMHASALLSSVALSDTVSRSAKIRALFGFALFYLLFISVWSYVFQAWWPFVAFAWLWVGKLIVALDKRLPSQERKSRMRSDWALSGLFYLAGTFLTLMLPIPKLGFTGIQMSRLDLSGSGVWVDQPQTVIAFGTIYFSLLAISKWRDWQLAAIQPVTRA